MGDTLVLWLQANWTTAGFVFLQDPNVNNIVAATTFYSQAGATLCLVLYLAFDKLSQDSHFELTPDIKSRTNF
jgi:hypothetical protein